MTLRCIRIRIAYSYYTYVAAGVTERKVRVGLILPHTFPGNAEPAMKSNTWTGVRAVEEDIVRRRQTTPPPVTKLTAAAERKKLLRAECTTVCKRARRRHSNRPIVKRLRGLPGPACLPGSSYTPLARRASKQAETREGRYLSLWGAAGGCSIPSEGARTYTRDRHLYSYNTYQVV